MKNALTIGAASAFTLALAAPGLAGTVTLADGDVIEGKVMSKDDDNVEVVHADLGTLTIPTSNVAGIKMSNSDPAYTGGGDEGWFFPGWDKSFSAGTTGTVGDTETLNFNLGFNTEYEDETDRWLIDAFYLYSETESEETVNWFSVDVLKDWLIPGEAYFYWGNIRYQDNQQRAFEQRISGFAGAGYEFINRPDDLKVLGRLGVGGIYDAGNVDDFTPELFIGLEGRWDIDSRSYLSAYTRIFPSLDPVFDEFRKEAGAIYNLELSIARGLSFQVEVLFDFDSSIDDPFEDTAVNYLASLKYDF